MTLSIDVLPAPFGPMMARISPLRMSNGHAADRPHAAERKRHVLHRQKHIPDRNIRTARRPSCRLPHGGNGFGLHVADFHARTDGALAAVLEGDLRRNVGFVRAVIERLDQWRIALGDEPAANLLRARESRRRRRRAPCAGSEIA